MLLVADNVINTYNYSDLLTTICKHAPVFVVKVPRPYFSTARPQGVCEKLDVWGQDYLSLAHPMCTPSPCSERLPLPLSLKICPPRVHPPPARDYHSPYVSCPPRVHPLPMQRETTTPLVSCLPCVHPLPMQRETTTPLFSCPPRVQPPGKRLPLPWSLAHPVHTSPTRDYHSLCLLPTPCAPSLQSRDYHSPCLLPTPLPTQQGTTTPLVSCPPRVQPPGKRLPLPWSLAHPVCTPPPHEKMCTPR